MNFDKTIKQEFTNNIELEYGIIHGNENIVFIKAGAGGSFHGYEGKYLKMARLLNSISGCTVICASNIDKTSFEKYDVKIIQDIIEEITAPKLYYIGVSNGAVQGIMSAAEKYDFEHFLSVLFRKKQQQIQPIRYFAKYQNSIHIRFRHTRFSIMSII